MVRGDSMEKKKNLFTRILSAIGHFLLSIPFGIKNWFVNKYKGAKKYFKNLFNKEYRRLKKMNTVKAPRADKIFNGINGVVMVVLILLVVIPLLYLLASAFSDGDAQTKVVFLPKVVDETTGNIRTGITFDHFKYILFDYQEGIFINSFKNTAVITLIVTLGSNVLMALAAYPLSKADFPFKKPVLIFFIITMLFSSGIVPIYLLMSSVNLTENIWGIIIISLSNVFNMLLFKTTFEGIPKELEESALIDGANSMQLFFRIIIPITLPTFASCCFFTLVGCINGYSGALLFIRRTHEAKPMALIMYELLAVAGKTQTDSYLISNLFNIQSAGIILTVIPILVIYPYIIKYIKSGITLGSVKG